MEIAYIDWDETDGMTPAERAEHDEKQEIERARQQRIDQILWERFSGHFDRQGRVVIPFKL